MSKPILRESYNLDEALGVPSVVQEQPSTPRTPNYWDYPVSDWETGLQNFEMALGSDPSNDILRQILSEIRKVPYLTNSTMLEVMDKQNELTLRIFEMLLKALGGEDDVDEGIRKDGMQEE